MCGEIVALGSSATRTWTKGQRVLSIFNQSHQKGQIKEQDFSTGLGLPLAGVLAQYRIFPVGGLVTVPDYLNDEEAACLPIAAVTAWMSINWMQPIGSHLTGSDVTVLFQGTGGVSISGLQIAKACGLQSMFYSANLSKQCTHCCSAIITSSSDEKLAKARYMGADHIINYKTHPKWSEEVMKITNSRGADIILETGGAKTLKQSFECIAFGGLISCIGYLSGKEDEKEDRTNVNVLALKRNVTLKGILNGPKDRFEEMLKLYAEKKIHPVVDKIYPLDQARDALQYLYSGSHFGKVVIKVASASA